MRRAIITAGWGALLIGAHLNAADVTGRILEGEVYYLVSLPPCEVPLAVTRIARVARISAGIERLPDDCPASWQPTASAVGHGKVSLTGKRVGEALNELVAADPRYAWIESDGVIVMRPVAAWTTRGHFLHRTIRSFTVVEQNVGVALQLWRQAVWEETTLPSAVGPARSEEMNRPISVTIARDSSAISALEQIARAHGRLLWEVIYRESFAECRFATVVFRTTEHPLGLAWNSGHYVSMQRRLGPAIYGCWSDE